MTRKGRVRQERKEGALAGKSNSMDYTKEQISDIQEREKQGLEALKALGLTPAVSMQFINAGNDSFNIRPIPYLQDTKFTPQASPLQKDALDSTD